MAKGYYSILFNTDKTDIIFEIVSDITTDIPEEQQNLAIEIGNTLPIISLLYKAESIEFKKAFDQLFYIAKTGLEGANSQPAMASKALIQFKKEIVDRESGRRKNAYLKQLGVCSLIGSIPLLAIGAVINYNACGAKASDCIEPQQIANMCILTGAALIGVWLSFAITRTYIAFDDLAIIEKDRLEPAIRLIFTGILAVIFGLLFIKSAMAIKLGDLSSHNIAADPITAFLVGTILGLNEKIIGSTLTKKTADLIK